MITLHVHPSEAHDVEVPEHDFAHVYGFAPLLSRAMTGLPDALHAQMCAPVMCGVAVHDARTVLGLKAWRDCVEGSGREGGMWTMYELEKLLRMTLRQSVLAADVISSVASGDFDGGWILSQALTWDFPVALAQQCTLSMAHMREDIRDFFASPERVIYMAWTLLTGVTLARQSLYCRHFPTLMEHHEDRLLTQALLDVTRGADVDGEACGVMAQRFEHLYDELMTRAQNNLPQRPAGYDVLHEFLIEQRMSTTRIG